MKEEDVLKFLAAGTHLGGTNLDFQMDQYVYKRKSDGEWWKMGKQLHVAPCDTNETVKAVKTWFLGRAPPC